MRTGQLARGVPGCRITSSSMSVKESWTWNHPRASNADSVLHSQVPAIVSSGMKVKSTSHTTQHSPPAAVDGTIRRAPARCEEVVVESGRRFSPLIWLLLDTGRERSAERIWGSSGAAQSAGSARRNLLTFTWSFNPPSNPFVPRSIGYVALRGELRENLLANICYSSCWCVAREYLRRRYICGAGFVIFRFLNSCLRPPPPPAQPGKQTAVVQRPFLPARSFNV